jgi:DNA-binding GntR family transcriptional regulator
MARIPSARARKRNVNADGSAVGRVYEELRRRAISFGLRPGEHLNEGEIARLLGVSRTPLREALNRLTSDGFVTFSPKQGFFRKPLEAKEIFDLWEFRLHIETAAAKLAVERGSDEAIAEIDHYLDQGGEDRPERTVEELVALDEGFHERIMALTGNAEMLLALRNLNARIQYVRIDLQARRETKHAEHREIIRALKERDHERCAALLYRHIEPRLDQIIDAVRSCYRRIYVDSDSVALV